MNEVCELDTLREAADARRLLCIAELMDAHSGVFGRPSSNQDWADLLQAGAVENDSDRQKINKACGMVAGIFRSAQLALDAEPIEETMSPERVPAAASILPDEATLKAIGGDSKDESSVAFARSMTLYKKLVEDQVVDAVQLQEFAEQQLDALPGSTALHMSLVETAKNIMRGDSRQLLGISAS